MIPYDKQNYALVVVSYEMYEMSLWLTIDSRYLEVEGTRWNTSRYP